MRSLRTAALALVLATLEPVAHATELEGVTHSPDITVALSGAVVRPSEAADDDLAGAITALAFPGVPSSANLAAYQIVEDGAELLVFDTTVALPGGVTATPRDVVRLAGGTWSIEFTDPSLPPGARIDAVARDPGGALLLSFDVTVSLAGVVADDEDLVRVGDGDVSVHLDGSAAGVPGAADLDGAHQLANGNLLLSLDISGNVGGVAFDDEDVLELNPRTGGWSLAYDGSAVHADWTPADLDAVDALAADSDADGIRDDADNCVQVPNGPDSSIGPAQRDTDGDGFGNVCDGDFNGDGVVNFADLALLKLGFFGSGPDLDLDGNGFVNFSDLARFKLAFLQPPGPSGLAP